MARFASPGGLDRVERLGKDAADDQNAGNHPWTIEKGTESTLLLFNYGGEKEIFNVSIFENGRQWVKTYMIEPMATASVSIRELIQDRVKDDDGNLLSEEIRNGELTWFSVKDFRGKGRLIQTNLETGSSRSYSCGAYVVLCPALTFVPYTTTFGVGSTVNFGSVSPRFARNGTGSCNQCTDATSGGATYGWSSGSPGIASISGSGSSKSVSLLGASGGTSMISAVAHAGRCTAGGGNPANVQVPTSEPISVSDIINQANSCPTNYAGWHRKVPKHIVD